jgi:glycosyltransferase involved in cell wall biosynthesis
MGKIIHDKILLSICISTYNRSEKVNKLVNEFLLHNGSEIEVVVTDNCSTDNTFGKLSEINDSRLILIKNPSNIGAIPNYIKSISEANGKFVVFCTDKDSIKISELPGIISFLTTNSYLSTGIFAFDLIEKSTNIIFDSSLKGLVNLAYLSRHPTGYFFNNSMLSEILLKNDYTDNTKFGVFPFEFIVTNLCLLGNSAIINSPFFRGESSDDIKGIKSFSFSGAQNNIYFYLNERLIFFSKYLDHLSMLNISYPAKIKLSKILTKRTIGLVTIFYKKMIEDEAVCYHYGITPRKVGMNEIFSNYFNLLFFFVFRCTFSNVFTRFLIFTSIHFDFSLMSKFLLRKFIK